jgi:hypothetical protein
MRIPFAVLVSLALALPIFAAPVAYDTTTDLEERTEQDDIDELAAWAPIPIGVDDFAIEVRTTKPAKAKAPAKPKAAPKPIAKPVVAKPPPKKAPAVKPAPKKAAAPAKPPVAPKKVPAKTTVKPPAKPPVAPKKVPAKTTAKPPAKPPVAPKKAPAKTTAKPPAKPPVAPKKAPTKSAAVKPAAKPSASAKTVCPLTAKKGGSRIKARAVSHPSARGSITLFHGTSSSQAASLVSQGVQLSKTAASGDFSHRPEVDGGFYMADSLIAAAQFACFELGQDSPTKVDVLEYTWNGAGVTVHEFPSRNTEFDSFLEYNEGDENVENTSDPFHAQAIEIFKSSMISGPLSGGDFDKDLRNDFQQYAVVRQPAASSKLVLKQRHQNILCKNVPKGEALTDDLYKQTQGGNSGFAAGVAALQDPNACT